MAKFAAGDSLISRWTPSHEDIPRHLLVTVLEVLPPAIDPGMPQLYRCQTNMGLTMIFTEGDLAKPNSNPPEAAFGEP